MLLLLSTITAAAQPAAKVSGRVVAADGHKLLSAAVMLTPLDDSTPAIRADEVTIMPDGRFTFGHVPPGRYQVRARAQTQPNGPALFATFGLVVESRDIANVTMTLQSGALLDGHVTVDSPDHATVPPLTSLTIRAPLTDGTGYGDALTGRVARDGTFVIRGLMPGMHHLLVEGLPDGWTVTQVTVRGHDIMDRAFEVSGQPLHDVRVNIASGESQLAGDVHDAQDRAAADAPVMIFSVSPQFWIRGGRRVQVIRTDASGQFSVRGLPPGAYLAIASRTLEATRRGQIPRELEPYRAGATAVEIAGAETHATVHLRLAALAPPVPAVN